MAYNCPRKWWSPLRDRTAGGDLSQGLRGVEGGPAVETRAQCDLCPRWTPFSAAGVLSYPGRAGEARHRWAKKRKNNAVDTCT